MPNPPPTSRLLVAMIALCLLASLAGPLAAAPMIRAQTLDGETVRLSDYFARERWTLVLVWTTYCPVCEREFPRLDALRTARGETGLEIIGVAIDGTGARAAVAATLGARGAPFESLVADPDEIAASFERLTGGDFQGTPTYLLFDGDGELAASSSGPLDRAELERFLDAHGP